MTSIKNEIVDTVDATLEMPAQYGSRALWIYQNLRVWTSIVALPILIGLIYIGNETPAASAVQWIGLGTIGAFMAAIIWRSWIVQKRSDRTGSPLVDREPY